MVSLHTSPAAQAGTGDAGGMNVAIRSLASELAARGVAVDLLTRAVAEPGMRELEPNVRLYELAAGGSRVLGKDELAAVSDEFGEAVSSLASTRNYDIIHAHYWLSGVAALPVALELGIPFVQSFHTLAAMKDRRAPAGAARESERRTKTESYLASQANAIVAASAAEATALVEDVHAPAGAVWVVSPGVDVDLFRPNRSSGSAALRQRLALAANAPVLVVVGRIQPLKNQELAIVALARLNTRTAPILVIVGESTPGDEPYRERLESLARSLGVADRVQFVGALAREELADLFALSSLTLVPSHSETFGLVALESAASGTPVVASHTTGLLESVSHGRSGVLVESLEPNEWAATITELLEDELLLTSLSTSAREHALAHTWAASATALVGIYASLGRA